jgi:L-asparaginase II
MVMVIDTGFVPVLELTRGDDVESIHYGAAVVVDAGGNLLAWVGDPERKTYLRSAAKPFQVLPFLEHGGVEYYGLSEREVALLCASHSGTDEHMAVLGSIQMKTGIKESDLLCGVHSPIDRQTAELMRARGEKLTPNRHNCSGKHTGMLAYTRMKEHESGHMMDDFRYIDTQHPIQREILLTFAEMCAVAPQQVGVGIDGCSVPNFALPLCDVALAFARLADPVQGGVQPPERAAACRTVASAMMSHPDMVGGPGRFDTRLMQVCRDRILVKGGAEGYQGVGLMKGAMGPGSPAIGIAAKIADGDRRKSVRPAVVLEILQQLGALSPDELDQLSEFGPNFPVRNWREIVVGEARPVFTLNQS